MPVPPGAWRSPLSAADPSAAGTEYGQLAVANGGRTVCWTELRPFEGGRSVVLRRVGAGFDWSTTKCGQGEVLLLAVMSRRSSTAGLAVKEHDE